MRRAIATIAIAWCMTSAGVGGDIGFAEPAAKASASAGVSADATASSGAAFANTCERHVSKSGVFTLCFDAAERPMVAVASDYLDAIERELVTQLGGALRDVRIEIVPSVAIFAERSGVAAADLIATQTVGIARDNAVILLSPRITLAGFRWLDTLAHELVHLHLATLAGPDVVPLWLQEGIARYYERIWRQPVGGALTAEEHAALALAMARRELPAIERLTSFASLGSPAAGQLAYAAALSYVQYLAPQSDTAGIRRTIAALASGVPVEQAIVQGFAVPTTWRQGWSKAMVRAASKARVETPLTGKADKYQRLAGLLRAEGYRDAAAIELQKAMAAHGRPSPGLTIRLARLLVEGGQVAEALRILRPLWGHVDGDLSLAPTLGYAAWLGGDLALARVALQQAVAQNPFDPDVRCTLFAVYRALAHPHAARENAACQLLHK